LDRLTAIFFFLSAPGWRLTTFSEFSDIFYSSEYFDGLCGTARKHPAEIRYSGCPWRESAPPPAQLVLSLNRRKAAPLNDPTVGEDHARKLPDVLQPSECGTLFARRRL
jgi:hypothetical protein